MALMTVGLIGCGRISDIYIQNLQRFDEIDLVACASLDLAESQAKAAQWGIPKACAPDDIYTVNKFRLDLTVLSFQLAGRTA